METLHTHLLCEILEILNKVKPKADSNPGFIREALFSGNAWAIRQEVPGLVDPSSVNPETVNEVRDILLMWDCMEDGYDDLSKKDRARVADEVPLSGEDPKFDGFDGTNEIEHLGVANFMVRTLGWFPRFTRRSMNSHIPRLEMHRRLHANFQPMRDNMAGRKLSGDQLVEILKARVHPSQRKGKGS
ncbi:MAG: YfbU family protein [Steroidobacteraceae bacterium]